MKPQQVRRVRAARRFAVQILGVADRDDALDVVACRIDGLGSSKVAQVARREQVGERLERTRGKAAEQQQPRLAEGAADLRDGQVHQPLAPIRSDEPSA
jgi:hypothetical protein